MKLREKVAIITGAARGIGKCYATAFGKEGAKVAVADEDFENANLVAETLKKKGTEVLCINTDVSSPESSQEMAEKTIEHFGRIDILVNNAGVLGSYTEDRAIPFYELDLGEWERVISINLKGTFLCIRAVFPHMKGGGGGKIVNIGTSTYYLGIPYMVHYVASKGGIVGLTRGLCKELGEYNININTVVPGSTLSEDPNDKIAVEFRKSAISRRAIRRLEYPEDLVGAVIFLASPESDFITGQTIVVDGGTVMH